MDIGFMWSIVIVLVIVLFISYVEE